jgi:peptide/nickel transport system ATP-binding protein
MSDPALEVVGLRKEFPTGRAEAAGGSTFVAVDDVHFAVAPGGALAVVGESGSGKTTIARMVAGLEIPSAGTIRVNGVERNPEARSKDHLAYSRAVQMVFQDPYSSLDPRQNIRSCLDEVLRLHHGGSTAQRSARIAELLHQVGLDARLADLRPRSLSGGQRQRVAIARALAVEPTVLILDEAVAALDVSIQAQVLNLLNTLRARLGITYLFITHDLGVAQYVCDQMVVMQKGSLVECGPSVEILSRPKSSYTQRLLEAVPRPGWVPQRRQMTRRADGAHPRGHEEPS